MYLGRWVSPWLVYLYIIVLEPRGSLPAVAIYRMSSRNCRHIMFMGTTKLLLDMVLQTSFQMQPMELQVLRMLWSMLVFQDPWANLQVLLLDIKVQVLDMIITVGSMNRFS